MLGVCGIALAGSGMDRCVRKRDVMNGAAQIAVGAVLGIAFEGFAFLNRWNLLAAAATGMALASFDREPMPVFSMSPKHLAAAVILFPGFWPHEAFSLSERAEIPFATNALVVACSIGMFAGWAAIANGVWNFVEPSKKFKALSTILLENAFRLGRRVDWVSVRTFCRESCALV